MLKGACLTTINDKIRKYIDSIIDNDFGSGKLTIVTWDMLDKSLYRGYYQLLRDSYHQYISDNYLE